MKTPRAFGKKTAGNGERFFADGSMGKALARSAYHVASSYACNFQQDPSQQSSMAQLVLAMAALSLDNGNTEEMAKRGCKDCNLSITAERLQQSLALDSEYVFINK
ncbi:hypothetical protein J3E72DRAFT_204781 [Bipolaris maydis]|nr:hypothetical protein J3E72DRAFT_204781 [Bipolaris maydis]